MSNASPRVIGIERPPSWRGCQRWIVSVDGPIGIERVPKVDCKGDAGAITEALETYRRLVLIRSDAR